jgi:hypothetical protein
MRWFTPLALAAVAMVAAASHADAAAALELTLLPDQVSYRSGQPIGLTLNVVNRSSEVVALRFRTSQRFDFIIRDATGVEHWRASSDEMFAQAIGDERLAPGTVLVYRAQCAVTLAPGTYSVEGAVVAEHRHATSATIRVD